MEFVSVLMHAESVTLWLQIVNRSPPGVHQPKWTSHDKRSSFVAQSYRPTSSAYGTNPSHVMFGVCWA